ncbi:triphosphoribosyl-dephospho-CoA synthase [Roseiconus sp. JC912]|uniref:triphosphoribosyl-dephospho-CoA synthase n=1 Tax=Roseiconus sp. JC912 TaxID=3396307 RepID=UPI003A4C5613
MRWRCPTPADAVLWACILEATAPKAGNVYPGKSFHDLSYNDFVSAAHLTAEQFRSPDARFSCDVLSAVRSVSNQIGTNVNLGILLLIAPLVKIDQQSKLTKDVNSTSLAISELLEQLDSEDASHLYSAINQAHPGGMGNVDDMDLADSPPPDFMSAMRSARARDQIAENYSDGFQDLLQVVAPTIETCIGDSGDVLTGISRAHLVLLRRRPDSLIARKFGDQVALQVMTKADFDHNDAKACEQFDNFLRTSHPKPLNPGTTADLIAAGLYFLLRCQ